MLTMLAYDTAQNKSAVSAEIRVTTDAAPKVTVSRSTISRVTRNLTFITVRQGTWTTPPGVPIPASELPGYNKITIDVGTATGLEAVFNNGSGIWDNNGGHNYVFPLGVSTYNAGVITPGAPAGATVSSVSDSPVVYLPIEFIQVSPWKMERKSA